MQIREDIKALADRFYRDTCEKNEVFFVKWTFPSDDLPDLSLARAESDDRLADETLAKVDSMLREPGLSHTDEIILKVLRYYCGYIKKNLLNYWHVFDLNHYTSPLPHLFEKLLALPYETEREKARYLAILEKFPDFLQALHGKLEQQAQRYIRMPLEACKIVLTTFERYMEMAAEMDRGGRTSLLSKEILGALRRLGDYVGGDYMHHAPQTIGMGQYPGGLDMYMRQVDTYISCDACPEEIQRTGYEALEATKKKMRAIMAQVGFQGTLEAFALSVREDPRFRFATPEEMQCAMSGYLDKIRPLMPKYFNRMPKADCAVARIDPRREATTSWGYYNIPVERPIGVYYYSAAELDKRCQVRDQAVVYHELLPGHHYQMNLVLEDPTLPDILHHHYNTACADGWAEYASGFCEEIGLYDPYTEYGRLTWDAFLCCRLIVDTGLNALGWTLENARDFLKQETMFTDRELYTELHRYAVGMPAQALSYKWGSLKFFGFKAKAVEALGEGFDLKEFHDVMLEFGSIPLNIIEEHFEWYIAEKKAGTYRAPEAAV